MDKCVSDWVSEFENILDTETQLDGSYIHPSVLAICHLIQKFYMMEFNNSENNVKKIAFTSTPHRLGSSNSSSTPNHYIQKNKDLDDSKQTEENINWRSPSTFPGLMSRSMSNLNIGIDLALLTRTVSLSNENGLIIFFCNFVNLKTKIRF